MTGKISNLYELVQEQADSPWAQQAKSGYETYFGVTQERLRAQAAQAEADAALGVAAEEAGTMRALATAGVVIALAGLLIAAAKR